MKNFYDECLAIIHNADVAEKCQLTKQLYADFIERTDQFDWQTTSVLEIAEAGRPLKPLLVTPDKVFKRRMGSIKGHASLIHALAHIEFNAINLALDACYRFQNLPQEYYQDWLEVAKDEVYHFELLQQHLLTLGFSYGDFDAHNGLWEMALKTDTSLLARMAMVPRTLEARGIDAVPHMQNKLHEAHDESGVKLLDIIHQDEIKHVRYGDKWFKFCCEEQGLDAETTYFSLLKQHDAPKIRGVYNREDRKKAGFSESELNQLRIL
jgi:uncharacterized ferritin-like protein (DUF455 family)